MIFGKHAKWRIIYFVLLPRGGHGGVYVKSLINKLNRLESGNVTNLGVHEGVYEEGEGSKSCGHLRIIMIKVEFRFSCGRGKFVCLVAFGEVLPLNMPRAEGVADIRRYMYLYNICIKLMIN